MQEKQAAELALQKKLEAEQLKGQQEKQRRKEEHRMEEELCMQTKDAEKGKRRAKVFAAEENVAQLVLPSELISTDANMENSALDVNLFAIMQGKVDGTEDVTNCFPLKNKPKKSTTTSSQIAPPVKHVVKSALKAGFNDNHVHNFPRVLVEVSIQLKGDTPKQEFIISLQELLKNG
jgi:hypothetical protein